MAEFRVRVSPGGTRCLPCARFRAGLDVITSGRSRWPSGKLRARMTRPAAALGARGDVAQHAAEHHAVERRDRPPVRVPGESAWLEDGALPVSRRAVAVAAG